MGRIKLQQFMAALLLFVGFCIAPPLHAQQAVPALSARVIDQTGTLTPNETAALDQRLSAFEKRKGSQIAVLIVPTTAPESIEQYGIRVADQWKIGRKKIDDGVILIVAKSDRQVRIEVGYGLEGALTDATSKRIIDDIIIPRFKQEDFDGGITAGIQAVMAVIDGETLPAPAQHTQEIDESFFQFLPFVLISALILGRILKGLMGRTVGASVTGVLLAVLTWWMIGVLTAALLAGIVGFLIALAGIGFVGRGFGGRGGGGFGGGGASGRW